MTKATPVDHLGDAGGHHYGTALERDAVERDDRRVPGTFVYTPAAGTVLNAGAAQTLSVTFTPTDTANYTTATASVAITVTKATPSITWAAPADITYGTALSATQLNATATRAGHLRLHAGGGHGAERGRGADAVGDLHADRRGELHDGDGDRRDHGAKATPTITWPTPADIIYGTALSATQLNATAERRRHLRLHAGRRARC